MKFYKRWWRLKENIFQKQSRVEDDRKDLVGEPQNTWENKKDSKNTRQKIGRTEKNKRHE